MGLWMGLGLDLNMNGSASLGGGGSGSKLYVSDSFNRPDNASTLGKADTGQTWSVVGSGPWGIISNQAYQASGSSRAVIDAGVSDNIRLSIVYGVPVASMRMIFRYSDTSNEWFVDVGASSISVVKREVGAITTLISSSTTIINGDEISVTLRGGVITLLVNGVVIGTTTNVFNQTATMHGLNANGSTVARYDNFKVEAL